MDNERLTGLLDLAEHRVSELLGEFTARVQQQQQGRFGGGAGEGWQSTHEMGRGGEFAEDDLQAEDIEGFRSTCMSMLAEGGGGGRVL